jgi:hypothetical protein
MWKTRGKGAGKNVQRFIEQLEYCKDSWIAAPLQDFVAEAVETPYSPSGDVSVDDSDY